MPRVAVVQAGSAMFDTPRTIERMQALCEAAHRGQAELVVFPEAYVGGYPKGLDFGARIGSRSEPGRNDYLRYARGAVEVPGPVTRTIGSFAAEMRAHLVVGVIERGGATLYCTALFFGPDGQLLAKHRKLMPTASERLIWGFGDGSTLPVVETPLGTIGAAICWENYMPLLRMAMYAQGVEIWCAPTVDDREIWRSSMRHIAYEGRCFVLSACQYLTRADCPSDYDCIQGEDPATVLIRGGSLVVSPAGELLAGPAEGREEVLFAEVDRASTVRGKYDLDVVGHYARPDVFQLHVDRRAHTPVMFSAAKRYDSAGASTTPPEDESL
jgi:nitrilase